MSTQAYHLLMQQGPQPGRTFPLLGNEVTLGRSPLSDIALDDPEVSRQHARLIRTETGGYQIQDLGSTNGTFVDGRRLGGEPVALRLGQTIRIGSNVILMFQSMSATDPLDATSIQAPQQPMSPAAGAGNPGHGAEWSFDDEEEEEEPLEPDEVDFPEAPPPRPTASPPPPAAPAGTRMPPPRVETADSEPLQERGGRSRKTLIIIAVALLVVLLCCCLLVLLFVVYSNSLTGEFQLNEIIPRELPLSLF